MLFIQKDGINDLDEIGLTALDSNGDGMIDSMDDMDGDGIIDFEDRNDEDTDTNDFGGLPAPTTNVWQQAIAPEILDPCNCLANESFLNAGDGQFSEEVKIISLSGETWTLTSVFGFYQNPTASFPPPSGGSGPYPQVLYSVETTFVETPLGNGESAYTLQGLHVDAVGYSVVATNGTHTLNIGHTCNYDDSCRSTLETTTEGTPGAPVADTVAHNFMVPVGNTPFRDTMKSCDSAKNLFTDDGTIDGLYSDATARNSVIRICPQTQWQTVMVSFTDFDLANGDALNVYEGTTTDFANQIAHMTGTGVSQANGGWVMAHCDPDTNATGCLTFQFRTNGDNNKGRGWAANVSCNDRGVQLTPPNDLHAQLTCEETFAELTIRPATVMADCGTVQDSQIVRVFNQKEVLCLDTCLASTDVVTEQFAIGQYKVEYKLKSDTTKVTEAVMSVQAPALVCNDVINVPLGSACSIMLTPDDLLENPCDTITDTIYYTITLKGVDEKGNSITLATGGGKGGTYPVLTKEMIDQCGGTITAEIERSYYEDLTLNICNNGVQTANCEVSVNLLDQTPPFFTNVSTVADTFRLCDAVLTAESLGLAAPTASDNCTEATVTFVDATILNEGATCDTTRALINWKATDACGNEATLAQSVVILRPEISDIVIPQNAVLSCGEDTESTFNDLAKTGVPSIKVGKVINGILVPTDTIPLDTADYVCGYVLQKTDVAVSADCGIKVFRTWEILDWCDAQNGPQPLTTQFKQ